MNSSSIKEDLESDGFYFTQDWVILNCINMNEFGKALYRIKNEEIPYPNLEALKTSYPPEVAMEKFENQLKNYFEEYGVLQNTAHLYEEKHISIILVEDILRAFELIGGPEGRFNLYYSDGHDSENYLIVNADITKFFLALAQHKK